ncbi:hypothetical protein L6R52_13495 [Myxococcota bacterium]|nr:hypothetical protein [Myxococcota bacterium]
MSRKKTASRRVLGALSLCVTGALAPASVVASPPERCPAIYRKAVLDLPFNPAFLEVDEYDDGLGGKRDGLTISSFYNAFLRPGQVPPIGFFARDLVARVSDLESISTNFDASRDVEILTDLGPGQPKTVWPNEAVRAPDGVFPFEAVVIPQGFHPAPFAGRLTAVNLDDPARTEYVIHQSTQNYSTGFTFPNDPRNSPRFYHRVLFIDMNGDGLKDLVTVRSGFRVGRWVYPPFSELVWFENPGAALDPATPWRETVLFGGPAAGFLGPDIHLAAHDFEGDGVPEIVATHFFSAFPAPPGAPPPSNGKIAIYGAPVGQTWAAVNATFFRLPRVRTLVDDQGYPFDVELVDLNHDGRTDVLATNHQPDDCTPATRNAVPGRVFALETPASGDLFGEDWPLHVLLDDIRPNASVPPFSPPGRLAPGRALAFFEQRAHEGLRKPSIVVGGDEASKVWVLTPAHPTDPTRWDYEARVVFDINDVYGPNATQTPLADPFGIDISTIGLVAVRYDAPHPGAFAELYIPVFEAKQVHVLTFRPASRHARVACTPDVRVGCSPP